MDGKEINKLMGNMCAGLQPAVRDSYAKAKGEQQRRDWLCQYIMDPEGCCCKGLDSTEVYHDEQKEIEDEWLYRGQLADRLKDTALTDILVEAGEFDDRVVEHKSAAAKGYKQFLWTTEKARKLIGARDSKKVIAEAELTAGEFKKIQASMQTNIGQGTGCEEESRPDEGA